MATVIAVHGTYAHVGNSPQSTKDEADERQWWQPDSVFERDIRELVMAEDGKLEVTRFEWSGENSEVDRREAGNKLLMQLRALEAQKERYCLVGHSHGGSVISAALLESAARKEPLANLQRWITVGTPFVSFKKERWLFTRLDLLRKVIFVASMMLFLMFLVYLVAELASGESMLFGTTFPGILVATGAMMSIPVVFFYFMLKILDRRGLLLYRRSVTGRARERFAVRWLSLTHSDDEAIQGLGFLPDAKLDFFSRSFAVSTITFFSVFALPLLYLLVLTSPTVMAGIADWLKTEVYDRRSSPEAEKAIQDLRHRLREARQRAAGQSARSGGDEQALTADERRAIWSEYREIRRDLAARHPNLSATERALRFRQRFFERDENPCEGGKLCGGGHDLRINSGLLLHVVTDELSWVLGSGGMGNWQTRWIWSLLVPAILVPLISGLVALALMLLVRGVAIAISRAASHVLNQLTNSEVKRAAFGNDTEGEIAVGAIDRPVWLDRSPTRLPTALANLVTAYSNGVASQSLAKFRHAIGQLASGEPRHSAKSAVTKYFTWKELVHSAYFDVPEFRKLVAQAVSRAEGFAPSARFQSDPDYATTAQWLAEIEGTSATTTPAVAAKPGPRDAAAVSAVVASTVKAEP